jgi:hypothetical protein
MPTDRQYTDIVEMGGVIHPGAIYRLDVFLATVGWGRAAMRRARRQGLRVVRDGRSVFVFADEFSRYLRDVMERTCDSNRTSNSGTR